MRGDDDDDGNKLIITSCKVISVDKRNTNSLTVDLEYSEAVRYRIFE
jgi:indole-3-glycerol phosphate synthase